MKLSNRCFAVLLSLVAGLATFNAQASDGQMYSVTVTNLTRGETFTPIMVATHRPGVRIFQLGEAASEELVAIAESGNITPLSDMLLNSGKALDVATNGGLLAPGESTTIMVKTKGGFRHISLAGMLIPTNDGFIALNGVRGPKHGSRMLMSPTYDAGSETNDEMCANIPGPICMGAALSPNDMGEGYVHVHGGIHGDADLDDAVYDWRNPTAKIVIKRM
jgi:hypothetical protein